MPRRKTTKEEDVRIMNLWATRDDPATSHDWAPETNELSNRATNVLARCREYTVAGVATLTPNVMRSVQGCGYETVREVEAWLDAHGMRFVHPTKVPPYPSAQTARAAAPATEQPLARDMTLRDHFAGMAMQAIVRSFQESTQLQPREGDRAISNEVVFPDEAILGDENDEENGIYDKSIALAAYRIADAMLAVRDHKPDQATKRA